MAHQTHIDDLPLPEQVDELKERIRQLEAMLCFDVPPPLGLTKSEWKVVRPLVRDGQASREQLLDELYWDRLDPPDQKILDVFLSKARRKLGASGVVIRSVWGWGYACDISTVPVWLAQAVRGRRASRRDFL